MKKRILVFALVVCLFVCAVPANAVEPRWDNTMSIILYQDYYANEGMYCYIEIVGHYHVTSIQNIDIVLSKKVGNTWVEVASWLDYSSDDDEFVCEVVAGHLRLADIASETFRLCVTADVYAGNSVEHVESYYDREF